MARLLREAGARVEVTYSSGPAATAALVEQSRRARATSSSPSEATAWWPRSPGPWSPRVARWACVPSGRGNDFARQLGLTARPEEVAETLLHATPRAVDVIDAGGQVVVGSVYVGVDSLASEIVNNARHVPHRVLYPYAAVRALVSYQPTTYRVEVDGVAAEYRAATVVVANSGYYGNGMHIAPAATLADGLLDVVVIQPRSRLRLISWLPKLYDGSHVELDEVLVLRGSSVTLSAATPATAYGDGERVAPLPVTATVRPAALQVLA